MEFFRKNQKVILVVVLIGVGLYVYSTFFKSDDTALPTDVASTEVGSEVLSLYNSLQSVTLDQSLFSSSLYKRLIDFSTPLPSQTPGRPNPFNVIGFD